MSVSCLRAQLGAHGGRRGWAAHARAVAVRTGPHSREAGRPGLGAAHRAPTHPPLALSLEICTFLLPHYFLPIGAVANAIKGLSWMAGGSTKSVFKVRGMRASACPAWLS